MKKLLQYLKEELKINKEDYTDFLKVIADLKVKIVDEEMAEKILGPLEGKLDKGILQIIDYMIMGGNETYTIQEIDKILKSDEIKYGTEPKAALTTAVHFLRLALIKLKK